METDFRRRQWILHGILSPTAWFRTLFSDYNRGHMARNHYDKVLFKGRTLVDFPDTPKLFINAVDVGKAARFVFSKNGIRSFFSQQLRSISQQEAEEISWSAPLPTVPGDRVESLRDLNVEPGSILVADAVYASSAFPFAYPHFPIADYFTGTDTPGAPTRALWRSLADGGLLDNSGLLTLFEEFQAVLRGAYDEVVSRPSEEVPPRIRFVLAISIDSSIDSIRPGELGREREYASHGTYLRHGTDSVSVAMRNERTRVVTDLVLGARAVFLPDWVEKDLSRFKDSVLRSGQPFCTKSWHECDSHWDVELAEGRLLLRPTVIMLSLRNAPMLLLDVEGKAGGELQELLRAAKLDKEPDRMSSKLIGELQAIRTDFTLSSHEARILDLAAHLLVDQYLGPTLASWADVAREALAAGRVLHDEHRGGPRETED